MLPTQNPPFLNRFVGHEDDLAEITRLLAPSSAAVPAPAGAHPAVRLLTLIGPGGIGKSRLAIEAVTRLAAHYREGARCVPLATVDDPDLAVTAIARVTGADLSPGRSARDDLCASLHDKHLLLLLDNFDQVISAAPLIADLLAAAPHLTFLVTSREPLRIPGEQEFPVPPLALPDPHNLPPVERLLGFSAIALFVQCAQAVRPDFLLTSDSAPAAIRVCRGLDGLPLAIELAAARVKTLSVEQIAARLPDCLDLLTQGSRTALPRHRTLRAAIDWSHDLLTEPERNLFRRLAVFPAGFTLAGALEVGAGDEESPSALLDRLAVLVDKSLVMAAPAQPEARYRILEPIRRFALDKLAVAGEAEAVQRRHLNFLLSGAEAARQALSGTNQEAGLAWFDTERANLRSALAWCLANSEAEAGLRLATALEPYWKLRGDARESSAWFSKLLAVGHDVPALARTNGRDQTPDLNSSETDHPRSATADPIPAYGDKPGVSSEIADTRFISIDAAAEPQLTIFALGTEHVHLGNQVLTIADWTYAKAREMLCYLVCSPSRTKEQIGLALWPDASKTQLHNNFRVTLHHLRRALGRHAWILFEDGAYRFNRALPHWIDFEIFEAHVVAAKKSLDADQAIADLEAAVGIYRGDFLESLTGDWPMLHREELRRLCQGALLLLGRLLFADARYAEAVEVYRRALAQDSYLETAHRGVMRCLARLGERSQALRHYDELVTLLKDEMGSPPAHETVALAERLRHDDEI